MTTEGVRRRIKGLTAREKRVAREFIWRSKIVDAFQYASPKCYEEILDLVRRVYKAAIKADKKGEA